MPASGGLLHADQARALVHGVGTKAEARSAVLELHVERLVVRRGQRVRLDTCRNEHLFGGVVLLAAGAHEAIVELREALIDVLVQLRIRDKLITDKIGTRSEGTRLNSSHRT